MAEQRSQSIYSMGARRHDRSDGERAMTGRYQVALIERFVPELLEVVAREAPPDVDFMAVKTDSLEETFRVIEDADYVITGKWGFTAEMMKAAPKLRLVQKWGVGIDKIDLEAMKKAGIPLAIAAGGNSIPTAEHTLALMLAVARQIVVADQATRAGRFPKVELRPNSVQLYQKVVGVVGLGNIGKRVAKLVSAFEPKEVLYHSRHRHPEAEKALGVKFAGLEHLLQQSDFVVLVVPLTDETQRMIGRRELEMMKPTAILVNVSRGGVVDEQVLYEALRDRRILGAGLDVLEKEPFPADSPFFKLSNVVITPHLASSTKDNVVNLARRCFRNIELFHQGRPLDRADVIIPAPPGEEAQPFEGPDKDGESLSSGRYEWVRKSTS